MRVWPSNPPADCPFEQSNAIKALAFTGRHAEYTGADTWYPSWASDDVLYSPWGSRKGNVRQIEASSGGPKQRQEEVENREAKAPRGVRKRLSCPRQRGIRGEALRCECLLGKLGRRRDERHPQQVTNGQHAVRETEGHGRCSRVRLAGQTRDRFQQGFMRADEMIIQAKPLDVEP